jgi:hypothetical protein
MQALHTLSTSTSGRVASRARRAPRHQPSPHVCDRVRSVPVVAAAKKGGGAKKGAQKKGGSALAGLLKKKEEAEQGGGAAAEAGSGDALARQEQYTDPDVLVQLMMITAAYKKQYGE